VLAFALIGVGVSASGTSLLVLLAKRVEASRRAGAATVVWLMMIVGFAVTAGTGRTLLDPYSPLRLVAVSRRRSRARLASRSSRIRGLEQGTRPCDAQAAAQASAPRPSLPRGARAGLGRTGRAAVHVFVFVSMLAYSAQDLILEPFAGAVFGFTPGESTQLSGLQHGGVLAGHAAASLAGRGATGGGFGSLRAWTIGGCLASAVALAGLVAAGDRTGWPLRATVFAAGRGQRRVLDRRDRLDDAPGRRGARMPAKACAWACGAPRRPSRSASAAGRHGRQRSRALADRISWRGLRGGVRARGAAVRAVGAAGRRGCPCIRHVIAGRRASASEPALTPVQAR
jgi:hypothetical protein